MEGTNPKRQRVDRSEEDTGEKEDVCVLCMRNSGELAQAQSLFCPEHSCMQCKKDAWKICELCEENCLSRKCPVCRGEVVKLNSSPHATIYFLYLLDAFIHIFQIVYVDNFLPLFGKLSTRLSCSMSTLTLRPI